MSRIVLVSTPTTGRVAVDDPTGDQAARALIGCHGYGQNAEAMLEEMRRIPGADAWRLVSVQALHRFYTRHDEAVVASWMTRQDREAAIADNIEYLNRVLTATAADVETVVLLGFSQGASMAARAAARASRPIAALIMLGGDIPPDIKHDESITLPPVLIGAGDRDSWYSQRVDADLAFLRSRGIRHELVRFAGGHEFTDEFRGAASRWMVSSSKSGNPARRD